MSGKGAAAQGKAGARPQKKRQSPSDDAEPAAKAAQAQRGNARQPAAKRQKANSGAAAPAPASGGILAAAAAFQQAQSAVLPRGRSAVASAAGAGGDEGGSSSSAAGDGDDNEVLFGRRKGASGSKPGSAGKPGDQKSVKAKLRELGMAPNNEKHAPKAGKQKGKSKDAEAGQGEGASASADGIGLSAFQEAQTGAGAAGAKAAVAKSAKSAAGLSAAALKPGMVMMGAVRTVGDFEATVNLPDGLVGALSLRELSDEMAARVDRFIDREDAGEDAMEDEDEEKALGGGRSNSDGSEDLPKLNQLLQPGQILCVGILALEGADGKKKQYELTTRPSVLNAGLTLEHLGGALNSPKAPPSGVPVWAAVASRQEKGWQLELGLGASEAPVAGVQAVVTGAIRGFLPFENVSQEKLEVGQVIRVNAIKVSGRVVTLRQPPVAAADDESEPAAPMPGGWVRSLPFPAFRPGLPVLARPQKQLESGISVAVGGLKATVQGHHLPAGLAQQLAAGAELPTTLVVRLLWADPERRVLAATALPHLVAWRPAPGFPPAGLGRGDYLRKLTVTANEEGLGVWFKGVVAGDAAAATELACFAPRSKLSDHELKPGQQLRKFPVGQVVDSATLAGKALPGVARVLGLDYLGGVANVTLEQSVLAQSILFVEQLRPGMPVQEAEVISVGEHGVMVRVGAAVKGIIPALHMADVAQVKNAAARFPVGKKLSCRVLSVDPQTGKVRLTAKQSLVKSSDPVIADYAGVRRRMDAGEAVLAHGVVVSARDFGAIVSFYGANTKALLPAAEIPLAPGETPQKVLQVGQPVRVKIVSCKPAVEKMVCSLSLTKAVNFPSAAEKAAQKAAAATSERPKPIIGEVLVADESEPQQQLQVVGFVSGSGSHSLNKDCLAALLRSPGKQSEKPEQASDAMDVDSDDESDKSGSDSDDENEEASGSAAGEEEQQDDFSTPMYRGLLLVRLGEGLRQRVLQANAGRLRNNNATSTAEPVVVGVLPASHLSDHPRNIERLARSFWPALAQGSNAAALIATSQKAVLSQGAQLFQDGNASKDATAGAKLSEALVLSTSLVPGSGPEAAGVLLVNLSRKPSLIEAARAGELPSRPDQIRKGQILHGYVRGIAPYGVFVGFAGSLHGLAPKKYVADEFVSNCADFFAVGQSCRAYVYQAASAEDNQTKLTLSLKASKTRDPSLAADLAFGRSFFAERDLASQTASKGAEGEGWLNRVPIGALLQAQVRRAHEQAVLLAVRPPSGPAEATLNGVAIRRAPTIDTSLSAQALAPGAELRCRVLDLDPSQSSPVLDVGLSQALCAPLELADDAASAASPKSSKKKRKSVSGSAGEAADPLRNLKAVRGLVAGQEVDARVLLVKAPLQYCVLGLPGWSGAVGFACTSGYNSRLAAHALLQPDQAVKATVAQVPKHAGERLVLALHLQQEVERKQAKTQGVSSAEDAADKAEKQDKKAAAAADKAATPQQPSKFFDPAITNGNQLQVGGEPVQVRIAGLRWPTVRVEFGPQLRRLVGGIHVSQLQQLAAALPLQEETSAAAGKKASGKKASKKAQAAKAESLLQIWQSCAEGGARHGRMLLVSILSRTVVELKNGGFSHELIACSPAGASAASSADQPSLASFAVGSEVSGYVNPEAAEKQSAKASTVWLEIAPGVRGRLAVVGEALASLPKDLSQVRCSVVANDGRNLELALPGTETVVAAKKQKSSAAAAMADDDDEDSDADSSDPGSSSEDEDEAPAQQRRARAASAARPRPGQLVSGVLVKKFEDRSGALVRITAPAAFAGQTAYLSVTQICDGFPNHPLKRLPAEGAALPTRAVVLDTHVQGEGNVGQRLLEAVQLCVRPSVVQAAEQALQELGEDEAEQAQVEADHAEPYRFPHSGWSDKASHAELTPAWTGALVKGYVKNISPTAGVFIWLGPNWVGRVRNRMLRDSFVANAAGLWKPGQKVKARVLEVATAEGRIELSLRESHMRKDFRLERADEIPGKKKGKDAAEAKDSGEAASAGNKLAKQQQALAQLRVGGLVKGTVSSVRKYGLLITLASTSGLTGLCHIGMVADRYLGNLEEYFKVGDRVMAVVIGLGEHQNKQKEQDSGAKDAGEAEGEEKQPKKRSRHGVRVSLALRPSLMQLVREGGELEFDPATGKPVIPKAAKGKAGSAATGLPELNQDDSDGEQPQEADSDAEMESLLGLLREGQGDGDSDDEGDDEADDDEDEEDEDGQDRSGSSGSAMQDDSDDDEDDEDEEEDDESSSDESEFDSDDDDENTTGPSSASSSAPVSSGFDALLAELYPEETQQQQQLQQSVVSTSASQMLGESDSEHGSDSEDDDEGDSDDDEGDDSDASKKSKKKGSQKKTRGQKLAERRRQERQILVREQELLDSNRRPTSESDFRRLLVARPESSYLYIQFMAWLLQAGRTEDARGVAEEGLRMIPHRQLQERMNLWLARLNLENLYGDEASLNEVLSEAARQNDGERIHLEMAKIFARSGKQERALGHYERVLVKKYGRNPEVWLAYVDTLFGLGRAEEARKVFNRAMAGDTPKLPKAEHLGYIVRMAQLEYRVKNGSALQGAAVFERVLTAHPKRADIWNVYLDQEEKSIREHSDDNPDGLSQAQRVDHCRRVFQRATELHLSGNKLKTLFKKWLRFEKTYGSEAHRAAVLAKAKAAAEKKFDS